MKLPYQVGTAAALFAATLGGCATPASSVRSPAEPTTAALPLTATTVATGSGAVRVERRSCGLKDGFIVLTVQLYNGSSLTQDVDVSTSFARSGPSGPATAHRSIPPGDSETLVLSETASARVSCDARLIETSHPEIQARAVPPGSVP